MHIELKPFPFHGLKEGDNCPTYNDYGLKCSGYLEKIEVDGGWHLECSECGYQGEYVLNPDEE